MFPEIARGLERPGKRTGETLLFTTAPKKAPPPGATGGIGTGGREVSRNVLVPDFPQGKARRAGTGPIRAKPFPGRDMDSKGKGIPVLLGKISKTRGVPTGIPPVSARLLPGVPGRKTAERTLNRFQEFPKPI